MMYTTLSAAALQSCCLLLGLTGCWGLAGPDGENLGSQILPVSGATQALQAAMVEADIIRQGSAGDAELAFLAELPPLAYATYTVHQNSARGLGAARSSVSSRYSASL